MAKVDPGPGSKRYGLPERDRGRHCLNCSRGTKVKGTKPGNSGGPSNGVGTGRINREEMA